MYERDLMDLRFLAIGLMSTWNLQSLASFNSIEQQ